MARTAATPPSPDDKPWLWEDGRWRALTDKVRAGRSLKPATWKDGARVAVALSFDSDHESWTLRLEIRHGWPYSGC